MIWPVPCEACGILTPWPGIKPRCPALGGKVLTTSLPGEPPFNLFLMDHLRCTRNSLDLCFSSSIQFFEAFFFFSFKPGHGILSEKALAPHSSTLAWKVPWTEESSRLQSMGSLRVVSLSLFPFMHWRRKWQPTPVFLPAKSQGRGSLVGCHLWGRTETDTTEVT